LIRKILSVQKEGKVKKSTLEPFNSTEKIKMKNILIVLFLTALIACNQEQPGDLKDIKLFRFGPAGSEKPAVELSNGKRLDISAFGEDFDQKFFESNGLSRLQKWLSENAGKCTEVSPDQRFGPCISRPSKVVAVGLNYADHVKEGTTASIQVLPSEPVLFLKATTAICGPYDNAIIPRNSKKMDWEVELAIVIGRKASYVSEAEAMNYVAGYTVLNDYSEREWQLEKDGNQWDKGKSSDTFAPVGPYFIPAQNIQDPQQLNLWLTVNDSTMQKANTRDMIFKIPALISYVSSFMTLLPGDIISTGTPAGVGNGHKPPVFLKDGDVVELGVENIGTQKQKVVSYDKAN
jgi:2-keto-4-pentenoate hydratase/2-oxohepta-3-ene-1,7-dioic acid hydratase in catechol pathway